MRSAGCARVRARQAGAAARGVREGDRRHPGQQDRARRSTGDLRLGGVLTCGPGVWDQPRHVTTRSGSATTRTSRARRPRRTPSPRPTSATRCAATCAPPTATAGGSADARSITYYPPAPTALTPPRVTRRPAPRPHAHLLARHLERRRRPRLPDDDPVDRATTSRSPARRPRPTRSPAPTWAATSAAACPSRGLATATATALYPTAPAIRSIPAVTRRSAARRQAQLQPRRVGRRGHHAPTPRPSSGCATARRSSARPATTTPSASPTSTTRSPAACAPRTWSTRTSSNVYPTSPAQRSQPGDRGRPAPRPHALLHARHLGRRRPHRRLRRQLRLVPPGHPRRPPARRTPSPPLDVDKQLRCTVTVEGKTDGQQPDDLRRRPANLTIPAISGDARLGRSAELLARDLG